jgi:hypothetical protein
MLKLSFVSAVSSSVMFPEMTDLAVEVWRSSDGEVCAYSYTNNEQHWMSFPSLASFYFDERGEEVQAIAYPTVRHDLIRDVYHRSVLPMVLQALGTEVLHASAIQTPRGVVALCAPSGTGKSTLAFGLSQRGYQLWADDAVAFAASDADSKAIPLPFSLHLRSDAARFFRVPVSLQLPLDSQKVPPIEKEQFPLIAVLVLSRLPEASEDVAVMAERLSSSQGFLSLLPHAYCFSLRDVQRRQRMMQQYLDLASRVQTYAIRFRTGLENLPMIVDGIEQVINDSR